MRLFLKKCVCLVFFLSSIGVLAAEEPDSICAFEASDVVVTSVNHREKMLTVEFAGPWHQTPIPEGKSYSKTACILIAQSEEDIAKLKSVESQFRTFLQKKIHVMISTKGCVSYGGNPFLLLHDTDVKIWR